MEAAKLLMQVTLGADKELQVREDSVFIHSLTHPEKNILLSYNRFVRLFYFYNSN